jgi:hypothetical protein
VSSKTPSPPRRTSAGADRRSGIDRRKADQGPPKGKRERRISVEPRKPDVQEVDLSPSDWAAFEATVPPATRKKTPG